MNRDHAVVIGGSIAGLCTARALARRFQRVTLVERDPFPASPEVRKGTPQGHHIHLLLALGASVLDGLFPGLDAELAKEGAVLLHFGEDVGFLGVHGWSLRFKPTIPTRTCSRSLLEHCLRRRVLATERVSTLTGREVTRLLTSAGAVTGVALAGPAPGADEERLEADLVVDASGRGSRASAWLKEMGRSAPTEEVVDAYVGYASRFYEGVQESWDGWRSIFVGWTQQFPRGGVFAPLEGGRTIVTLIGAAKDYPPVDEDGFVAFARSLRAPHVHDAIASGRPVSEIRGTRSTANRWLHYERLTDQPAGFVALGDAVCAFNPAYGQGMTVSAIGATYLGEMLERPIPAGQFPRRFQRRLAKFVGKCWGMATSEDFRFSTTQGKVPATLRLGHLYLDRVLKLCAGDPDLSRTATRVLQLLDPPTFILHPRTVLRVLAGALLG